MSFVSGLVGLGSGAWYAPDTIMNLCPEDGRPVTIVLGSSDPLTPADDYDEIRYRYPGAAMHVLDPCSHFAHFEQPAKNKNRPKQKH